MKMKFMESWRLAVKCIKLSYNLKANLFTFGFLFVMALVYEITNFVNGVGAIMLLTMAMYPTQMIYSVCGSHLVQSSPHKKAIMTSLPTAITFCCGILAYLALIAIEGIRAIRNPESVEYNTRLILLGGMMLLYLNIYVSVAFKYFWVSVIAMVGFMIGFYYLVGIIGNGVIALSWFSGITMPVAIAVGLCLAVLGSLLQYGVSLLVYKKPISRHAIYGLMRQQA